MQQLPKMLFATIGISIFIPFAAAAEKLPENNGAPVMLAQAPVLVARKHAPATRRPDARKSIAARSRKPERKAAIREIQTRNAVGASEFDADDLIGVSLYESVPGGLRKRNLEFSGRSGPKLRIGMRQKKVRFALNFKVDEDVYFAPAYRLAIARGDFQNPNGYTAHAVFFGMRFKFGSRTQ